MRTRQNELAKDDEGISAVVGAILMIAVTVVIGATVYAAMNGFGDDEVSDGPQAAYRAQAIDTDGDGKSDRIKITYLTGPTGVGNSDVALAVKDDGGNDVDPVADKTTDWSPGDFVLYDGAAGPHFVTVSILGTTVVDQTLTLDE